MAEQHDRIGYAHGCRCAACCEANTEYSRWWRARKRGLEPAADLPESAVRAESPAAADGPVVAAVKAELLRLPAAESRTGLAAGAVRMAEVLDDRRLSTTPSARRQLAAALATLRDAVPSSRGRLAAVTKMSPAKPS